MTDVLGLRKVMRGVVGLMLGVGLLLGVTAPVAQDYGGSGESGGSEGERQTRKVSGINAKTYEKFARAQELMEADNYQGTLNVLNEIKAKPKLSSAEAIQLYSFYGAVYFAMENYKESIKAFEAMLAQPDLEERQRTEILYTLAQLHFTIEDWQGAVDILQDDLGNLQWAQAGVSTRCRVSGVRGTTRTSSDKQRHGNRKNSPRETATSFRCKGHTFRGRLLLLQLRRSRTTPSGKAPRPPTERSTAPLG